MSELTRYQMRSRRRREQRATTENSRFLNKRRLRLLAEEAGPTDHDRPKTRGECVDVDRPCPFVGCRYHLYLDVQESGSIKYNFPDLEPDQLLETCALDVADLGGLTLEDVAELTNVTRERIRMIEVDTMRKVRERVQHLVPLNDRRPVPTSLASGFE